MPHTKPGSSRIGIIGRITQWLHRRGLKSVNRVATSLLVATSLVAAVLLIITTIDAERAQRAQAERTNAILTELRNVGHAAINAETGQRGYFITLDPRYLGPYQLGLEQSRPALARLKTLIATDDASARQHDLLTEIDQLSTAKFAEIGESIAMIQRGDVAEAQTRFLSDEGEEVMNRLRRALSEMERIEQGVLRNAINRSATAEARVLPLLGLLLAMLLAASALGLRQAIHAARAETAEAHADEVTEARDRADLLARELNHRVKNLFAVILAIVRLSARTSPAAKPVTDSIAHRIQALLIAHNVTQGGGKEPVADLAHLVDTTLAPHRSSQRACTVSGPQVKLPVEKVQSLGLVLHELATNAVKYGAWSQNGSLNVVWDLAPDDQDMLVLHWREHCPDGCIAGDHKGFGSMLIDSSARQLDGTIVRDFTPQGCVVEITFPLTATEPPA